MVQLSLVIKSEPPLLVTIHNQIERAISEGAIFDVVPRIGCNRVSAYFESVRHNIIGAARLKWVYNIMRYILGLVLEKLKRLELRAESDG